MSETYSSAAADSTVSPLDRSFHFTIIPDLSGATMSVEELSLRELAAKAKGTRRKVKERLPLFSGAAFGRALSDKGSLRWDENVTAVEAVVVDYDGGKIPIGAARATLNSAGLHCLVMTSPRNGLPGFGHRWRGVFPLSRLHEPAVYGALVACVNGLFGGALAVESFTRSQSYFLGHTGKITTYLVEGLRWLDEAPDLNAGAIGGRRRENDRAKCDDAKKWGHPLDVLRDALMSIPNDAEHGPDRPGWLKIVAAMNFETDGSPEGFAVLDEWSQAWPGYDAGKTRSAWDSFRRTTGPMATGRHIQRLALDHGWVDSEELRRMFGLFDDLAEEQEREAAEEADMWADVESMTDRPGHGKAPGDDGDGLRVLTPDECEEGPEVPYVLKGLVEAQNVMTAVGAPGVGKSVLVPRLGYAVAQGEPIFGMRTRQGRVFYVAAENPRDMKRRVRALRRAHGPANDFRLFLDGGGRLTPKSDFLKKLKARIKTEKPILIVIDTLSAAVPGLDENSPEGMGTAIATVRSLTKWGAAVIVVHHDTKAGDGLPRGHGSLHGIVDANLVLTKAGRGVVRGACSKNRAGPSDVELFAFTNRRVELGIDHDGDPITTVICEAASAEPREARLPPAARAAVAILVGLMAGRAVVSEDEWRKACVEGRVVSQAEDLKSRQVAFRRAVTALLEARKVTAVEGGYSLTSVRGQETFNDG